MNTYKDWKEWQKKWDIDYKEFFLNERRFTESSINKIMQQGENGMIITSICRSSIESDVPENDLSEEFKLWCYKNHRKPDKASKEKFLEERNAQADRKLKEELKDPENPYTYAPVYGSYRGTDGVVDESEKSFIVFNSYNRYKNKQGSWEDLYNRAIKWCKEYKQDSVFIQSPNEAPYYVNQYGKKISVKSSKNFKFNVPDETYFTTVKRKKGASNFTADILFENFIRRDLPTSMMDRMKRSQRGEIWNL